MIRDLLRSVAPSVLVVLVGTLSAAAATSASVIGNMSIAATQEDRGHDESSVSPIHAVLLISQASVETPSRSGSVVELDPPVVSDYWMSITRQPSGTLVFDGYVPNERTRLALGDVEGADVQFLKLGGGAPGFYRPAVDFALEILDRMSEGRVGLNGNAMSVTGLARSPEQARTIRGLLETNLPAGVSLAQAEIEPAASATVEAVTPYSWSAERLADSSFAFDGNVPAQSLQDYLAVHVGTEFADTSTISPGAPLGFAAAVRAAVDALLLLEQGRAVFDGSDWTLTGEAENPTARDASLALVSTALGIDASEGISTPVEQAYVWTARKSVNGAVAFSGNVPSDASKRFLAIRGGDDVVDETEIRENAPEDFAVGLLKALNLLEVLDQGEIAFDGKSWSATGTLADVSEAEAAEIVAGGSAWTLALSAPQQPPAIETSTTEEETAEAEPATAATPLAPAPSPAAIAACRATLAELSQHNAILFQSGAAVIAASAATELDAFASALALCPESAVYVEGHTDSDGDDRKNLALSVARAEAVVSALTERGISPQRLYAVGYGESQPIADNSSADGKRQNRRIVVSLRDS